MSLGSGLFHLARGDGEEDSAKLALALTVRISLSLALFVLLFVAWRLGLLVPHPLGGGLAAPHP